MGKISAGMVLVLSSLWPAAAADVSTSPPYTVVVMLSCDSPFIADGRSSFAEFAFSVTFKNVRVHYDLEKPVPMLAFRIEGATGKGTLTRHKLNKVETGGKVVTPRVIKEPRREFEATLRIVPGPMREEWVDLEGDILIPIPFRFITSWGREMMSWDYDVGHSYLEEVGIEVFLVDWTQLEHGKPVSLEFPYKGTDPEDKGSWWIEFIPEK